MDDIGGEPGIDRLRAAMELDNPIWSALTTRHRELAEGTGRIRRYPPEVTLLAGLDAPDQAAFEALHRLLAPGEIAILFLDGLLPSDLRADVIETDRVAQMICRAPKPVDASPLTLGVADLPEMMALTARTRPGPFGPRTPELGHYVGLRVGGVLAAMAGERMRLPGVTEVSAVCTAAEHRGQGLASALVAHLAWAIHGRGERAMLHVRASNRSAISVYEKLGFELRREFQMSAVSRT